MLEVACLAADTTLTLQGVTGLPTGSSFRMRMGAELMQVTAVNTSTNQITVVRGTESTLASPQAIGTPVVPVPTAAAMAAFALTVLPPQFVTALRTTSPVAQNGRQFLPLDGYSAAGDGGGGQFVWNATDTRTDDGGTILQVTGIATGRWNRVFSGAYSVRWFGAKGDGVTNDTASVLLAIVATNAVPGSVLYFQMGVYLVNTNTLQVTVNGSHWKGDVGSNSPLSGAATSSECGAVLLGNGPGTVIAGPNTMGTFQGLNVGHVTIERIGIAWTSAANGAGTGVNKGIDISGFLWSKIEHVDIVLPSACAAYGFYARASVFGGVAQACYYNRFDHNKVFGQAASGSKGYYFASNPTNYGSGVNATHLVGDFVSNCDVSFHFEDVNGVEGFGLTSEASATGMVWVGGTSATGANCHGVHLSFAYQEGNSGYGYRAFWSNPGNTGGIEIKWSSGGSFPAGSSLEAMVDPASVRAAARFQIAGVDMGNLAVAPYTTLTPGNYQGVFSGQIATRAPFAQLLGGTLVPGVNTLNDVINAYNQLWYDVRRFINRATFAGALEPWSPELLSTRPSCWWRADQGMSRQPDTSVGFWFDMIQNYPGTELLPTGSGILYKDPRFTTIEGQNANDFPPPLGQPFIRFTGAGYLQCALPSNMTSVTVIVVARTSDSADAQCFVELTDNTGALNGGVQLSVVKISGSTYLSARRLSSDAKVAFAAANIGNWQLAAARFSTSSADLYVGNQKVATDSSTQSYPTLTTITIGANYNAGTPINELAGGIAEVIVMPAFCTDGDIESAMWAYAATRYATP